MQLSKTFVTTIAELSTERRRQASLYLEFLRVPAMSAGLYELEANAEDPQTPHSEDEIYYILTGRSQIRIAESDYPVAAGSVVFVPAGVEHHFHSIEVALSILVFFAPAEIN
jgi:mannose-6-phosphate isomerase-like protein (cupin superfamily)